MSAKQKGVPPRIDFGNSLKPPSHSIANYGGRRRRDPLRRREGANTQYTMLGLVRQAVYGRTGGYEEST